MASKPDYLTVKRIDRIKGIRTAVKKVMNGELRYGSQVPDKDAPFSKLHAPLSKFLKSHRSSCNKFVAMSLPHSMIAL
jgi:hypothetical protein